MTAHTLADEPIISNSPGAMRSVACPVCSGVLNRKLYDSARDPITGDCFQVVQCAACSMAYTTPVPEDLERYYPSRYRAYGSLVTRVLAALYGFRVSRWARSRLGGGSVLEVGCGSGLMLGAFKRQGWRVLGLERNEAAAEIGRKSSDLEILSTPIEAIPEARQFDLIIMFQVLEHISDPVGLLKECAKRLAPGGRLVANVPNFASWQSQFAGAKWFHLDVPRHVNHFTPQTLKATLERAGLHAVEIQFASFEHDPYGWVESLLSLITGRQNLLTRYLMGFDVFGPSVILGFLLGAILAPEALLLSIASWMAGRGALMEVTAVELIP